MSSSKKLTCKGDTVSHVGIFDPALWTFAPLTFLVHPLPPPPSLSQCSWVGVGGVGSFWSPYYAGVLHSLSDQIQDLQNFKDTPNKNQGRRPQTDKHLPQNPFTGKFFRWRHFALLSMSLIVLREQPSLKLTSCSGSLPLFCEVCICKKVIYPTPPSSFSILYLWSTVYSSST
jgi:hypothetical protein